MKKTIIASVMALATLAAGAKTAASKSAAAIPLIVLMLFSSCVFPVTCQTARTPAS